jgi:MtN3 and saliva related transmembrane protein
VAVLGLLAGALTTLSFLPQVIRTVRLRSARELSWGWLLLFGTGITGWLTYGVLAGDLPITVTNLTTLALVGVLASVKARQASTGLRVVAHQRREDQ